MMKLGIVGTGTIVKEVLPFLAGCGWEAAAICSTPRSGAAGKALCAQYGMKEAFTDFSEMLSGAPLDAVYIAVPNHLHYAMAEKALMAGVPAIVEKPMASNYKEACALAELAEKKDLCLFEAISTLYLPNFQKAREQIDRLGDIRLVSCNFSQYSRRYDAFQKGELPPVFDPQKSGGALMDLNVYNVHYLCALFGAPNKVEYHPRMERGIDTNGVLLLDYGTFQAVSIAAKDCSAPSGCLIQGTRGCLLQEDSANRCGAVTIRLGDGTEEVFTEEPVHRMIPEFQFFARALARGERGCGMLSHSLAVAKVLTEARLGAGITFEADG